jgi:hypothetical protein
VSGKGCIYPKELADGWAFHDLKNKGIAPKALVFGVTNPVMVQGAVFAGISITEGWSQDPFEVVRTADTVRVDPSSKRIERQAAHNPLGLRASFRFRTALTDPKLLAPLRRRGEASRARLALIRSRQALVNARTRLVNHARESVESFGGRLSRCSTASFDKKVAEQVPREPRPALELLLETVTSLSASIQHHDRELEALVQEHYPETKLLRQVQGVGTLTALAFVLTLGDPERFEESRQVGAYPGWCPPKITESDERDPQSVSLERATGCSGVFW